MSSNITDAVTGAYLELKALQGGLSAVSIGKLLQRTGLPKEAVHSFLLEQARGGNADLHPTTLINLSAEDREGALRIRGRDEPAITVTLRPQRAVFYDLEPGDGSHYLCKDGEQIARFDDVKKAEAVREVFMQAEAERLQRQIDELYCERSENVKEEEQGLEL